MCVHREFWISSHDSVMNIIQRILQILQTDAGQDILRLLGKLILALLEVNQ